MTGPSRAVPENGAVVRPVLIAIFFFALFACLELAAGLFQTFPRTSLCYLPAGLCLALVLLYGARYSILIVVAQLGAEVFLKPLSSGIGDSLIYSVAVGTVYFGAAVVLSRLLGRMSGFQSRPALTLFLVGGVLISVSISLLTAGDLWATGVVEWNSLWGVFTHGSIGILLGIFSVTPFLILVAAPFLEAGLQRFADEEASAGQVETHPVERSRGALVAIAGGFALFGLITIMALTMRIEDAFLIFCLMLPPFLGVALLAGLEVAAAANFGAILASVTMQWDLNLGFQQTTEFHALLILVFINGMLVGTLVSEKKLLQGTDNYREAVLGSVSFAAQELAGAENWEMYFSEVLRHFGEASMSPYVCVFEAWPGKNDFDFELLPYEWSSPRYTVDREQLVLLNRLRGRELRKRVGDLGRGEVWTDPPPNSTHEEKAVWTASRLRSTLVVPIQVDQELWGCLLLGRTDLQPEWNKQETDSVRYAVRTLGSLLASARTAQQIQQLAENIRGDLWISSPDGHRRIGLSSRGDTGAALGEKRLPDAWMDAVHVDDVAKIESALSGRGDFDLEYRIVLTNGEIRWVRDRGFVVRNEMGQISRVIGIAEDVSSQKNVEDKLDQSVDLLAALLDQMGSGILVEDEQARVCHINKSFFEILDLEAPVEPATGESSVKLFSKSKVSARKVEEIRTEGLPVIDEDLEAGDTILKLNYVPLSISRSRRYHLWQFHEVKEEEKKGPELEGVLEAREALLRETYRTVRNDLQVFYGLLRLQAARVQDEKIRGYFSADQTRVMAIALVHERLSQAPELGKLDFPEYAKNLTGQLVKNYLADPQSVRIHFDVEPLPLELPKAIPCGLIVNELVTNSLRHAFPDNRQGEILIRFGQANGHNLRLVVRDNGVGFPKGLDFKKTSTLGLMLVTGLTEQLGGDIVMRNHHGTEFDVSFPANGTAHLQAPVPAKTPEAYPSHQSVS